MYGAELYTAVRRAVVEEGLSHHEAGRRFGTDRRTVKKMLSYPEGESGQSFERLSERFGRGAMDRPGQGTACPAMSMRSPQGSRFQSPGGWL